MICKICEQTNAGIKENHCKDCCCAKSWEALGITEFTGKSIPEHIQDLRKRHDLLWDMDRKIIADMTAEINVLKAGLDSPQPGKEQNLKFQLEAAHEKIVDLVEANRLLVEELTNLKDVFARLQRTVKFQEAEYLENHGGSWGKCKYQAKAEHLQKECDRLRIRYDVR